jgi:hypothetical protein
MAPAAQTQLGWANCRPSAPNRLGGPLAGSDSDPSGPAGKFQMNVVKELQRINAAEVITDESYQTDGICESQNNYP